MPPQIPPDADPDAGAAGPAARFLRGVVLAGLFASPLIALVIVPALYFPFITGKGFAFRALVEFVSAAWICLAVLDPRCRPRGSAILACFAALLAVMAAADAQGADPARSFFGTLARMEGYTMLLHLFAFFLVAGTVLQSSALWRRYFATSIGVSVLVGAVGLMQRAGIVTAFWGVTRVDGTFGNPALLATYMLIHVFLSAYLMAGTRRIWARAALGAALALDLAVLWLTATRGAAVGLGCGIAIAAALLLWRRDGARPAVRRAAAAALALVVLAATSLAVLRHSPVIANNTMLARFAEVGAAADTLDTRIRIWAIAWQAVRERPVLGWGQENFTTVFERKFDPVLARETEWADRAHNLVLDWLVAGGALGALAYLSLFAAALWGVWSRAGPRLEQALLTGLLVGYFVDLLSFFDSVASEMTFAALLAFVHAGTVREAAPARPLARRYAGAAIAASVAMLAVAFALDARGLLATAALRRAVVAGPEPQIVTAPATGSVEFKPLARDAAPDFRRQWFRTAIGYGSFATPEIRELLALDTYGRLLSDGDPRLRELLAPDAIAALQAQLAATPQAVRIRLFLGGLYVVTGRFDDAIAALEPARTLAPRRQSILQMLATAYQGKGDSATALSLLQQALDLDPGNDEVRLALAATAIGDGAVERGQALLVARYGTDLVPDDRIIAAFDRAGRIDTVVALWRMRVESEPQNKDYRLKLAGALMRAGQGIAALRELGKLNEALRPRAPP